MNYIITGHLGLIGSNLKKRLDKEHNCVIAIDKREGFDVRDLSRRAELKEKADIFFHFSAHCRINEGIVKPQLPYENNVEGIFHVLEFCRKNKIPKIVVASSSRVLHKERNPYVASKIYIEEIVKAYSECYGIEYIIVRPSTVYAPFVDETSRLINNFLVSAFKNLSLRIYGNKEKTLDFTYIDDFVDGILLAVGGPWNKEYNISSGQESRLLDLAEKIIDKVGSKSEIIFLPEEKAQPQNVCVDISDIKKIGFSPKVNLDEGVQKMVDWYKENPSAIESYVDKGREFYEENKKSNFK